MPETTDEALSAFSEARFNPLLERELWAEACLHHFWPYLLYAFGALAYTQRNPHQDWVELDGIHRVAAEWLDDRAKTWEATRATRVTPMRLLGLMPRGTAKSIVWTCSFASWLHLRNVNLSSYIDSYKLKISQDFLSVIQCVWAGQAAGAWFPQLYSVWKPSGIRGWTANECTHAARTDLERKDPSFECVSVETGLTSHHPDTIHEDDLVVEEKLREEGHAWIDQVERHRGQIPYALLNNGLETLCMTRYTDDDPGVIAMRREGVLSFADTGQRPHADDYIFDPENGLWEVFFAAGLDDKSRVYFPKIWPKLRIDSEGRKNPAYIASQVMLHPMSGKHHPVQPEHIDRAWVERDSLDLTKLRLVMHFDTAFDPKRRSKGDYSAIILAGHYMDGSGKVVFLQAPHDQAWSDTDFADVFASMLTDLQADGLWPFAYTDEASPGKAGWMGSFMRTYLEKYGLTPPRFIEIQRGGGPSKEARKSHACGFVQSGHVQFLRGGLGIDTLVSQYLAFPDQWRGHDDLIDPSADTFRAPEIYKPAFVRPASLGEDRPVMERPFDQLLRTPPRLWSDREADRMYAEAAKHAERLAQPRARIVRSLGGKLWRR